MKPAKSLLLAEAVTASRPGEGGHDEPVLKETTLALSAGELLAVVGPSGSGKSTLLRLFNRLLEPDSGQLFFCGKALPSYDPPDLRAQISLVPQKPYLFPGTVEANLLMPARLRQSARPDLQSREIRLLMQMCHVDHEWLTRDARKLSVGQQQRVCLLRAMLGPCKALLLDEPTSALDRPTADLLAETFRTLAAEKELAILFVTHDLRLAERCADRVALMQDGQIIEQGPVAQLLKQPETEAARRFLARGPDRERGADR